ncbi:MAG: IS5 family transposase [Thermoguttaceae bacterium]
MEHVHPKKGGKRWRDAHCGKETKLMVVVDGQGMPIGLKLTSATPNESTLIESTLDTIRVPRKGKERPRKRFPRLIYDRAADRHQLRHRLKTERKIDLICPQRSNRKVKVQDGRKLRRYRRRWKIERTNAWLQNFRRVLVRFDHSITMSTGFVTLACIMITLRQL